MPIFPLHVHVCVCYTGAQIVGTCVLVPHLLSSAHVAHYRHDSLTGTKCPKMLTEGVKLDSEITFTKKGFIVAFMHLTSIWPLCSISYLILIILQLYFLLFDT